MDENLYLGIILEKVRWPLRPLARLWFFSFNFKIRIRIHLEGVFLEHLKKIYMGMLKRYTISTQILNELKASNDLLYWVERPFQHISGHVKTAPACNSGYDNHFIVLSHWNITPQAQSYDIPPGHISLATDQSVFALTYPLYVERLTRELQLSIWNLWFDTAWNRTQLDYTPNTLGLAFWVALSSN